jgi:hypothetical protein
MVIGMYMMSMNIPSRKEQGFDTYSFREREIMSTYKWKISPTLQEEA